MIEYPLQYAALQVAKRRDFMLKTVKNFFSGSTGKTAIATAWAGAVVACLMMIWWHDQPKFQNVTMELGERMPPLSAFLSEYAIAGWARMDTPEADIDLSSVGEQTLQFQHGYQTEAVTLFIVDTTAPKVSFQDVTVPVTDTPAPEAFVAEVFDLSPTTVSLAQPIPEPTSYDAAAVTVVVTDSSGNAVSKICNLYYLWMQPAITLELGDTLEKEDLLLNPQQDADLLDQAALDAINAAPLGEYTVTSISGNATCTSTVTVQDTTPPELVLKWVTTYANVPVNAEAFVKSVSDLSGDVTIRYAEPLPDFALPEIQVVTIEAVDSSGNVRAEKATLEVIADAAAPVFSGLGALTVEKNATPDYTAGVSAYDENDGAVTFTYDASKVNTSQAGYYYVTYTAVDRAGNRATMRRQIIVSHDAADTAALVSSIAAKLSSDPEAIRDYVRSTIGYSTNWGGSDPVWYGFKNKTGNCYVHALCLQRLLQEKGYSTQLIWVTDQTHYWLLINLGGGWKHIDATPSSLHGRYSLMNDAQRMETLSGRDWDHSAWPACS